MDYGEPLRALRMTSKKGSETGELPIEQIAQRILFVRSQKVMLDADLAELYGTETKRLNEQVKRNQKRFPKDFSYQPQRKQRWSQIATTSKS